MKVAVCVPCRDEVMTGFAFDFARMVGHDSATRCQKKGNELMLYTLAGTLIFDQRERLVETALKEGADAILFIDSDMRFPHDMIEIMLSRNVGIVGVNATTRRNPTLPTAVNLIKTEDEDGNIISHKWEKVDSRGKDYMESVTAIGFGAVMIRKEVFKAVPKAWFDAGWGKTGIIGEDIHFCVKARDNGFEVYCDHELSMHIKHIGIKEFGWNDLNVEELEAHNGADNL